MCVGGGVRVCVLGVLGCVCFGSLCVCVCVLDLCECLKCVNVFSSFLGFSKKRGRGRVSVCVCVCVCVCVYSNIFVCVLN